MPVRTRLTLLLSLFTGMSCIFFSCSDHTKKTGKELVIFHAGSLAVPFKIMADSFINQNPGTRVLTESAGSVATARKVTELGKSCDLMAVADYAVIDDMMIPGFATWNFKFATNEMAIVFNMHSKYAEEISGANWTELLLRPDVRYGRSDPDTDPCGYRTVLALKLAEKYYHKPGLEKEFLSRHRRHIRPKEVDLLALLESGTLDYLFLYRSVAIQHKLRYIPLPDSVNLKNPDLAAWYAGVSTEIKGDAPGKLRKVIGEPMVYSICLPKNAKNPEMAGAFLRYLTDPGGGMKIMADCGQPSAIPASTKTYQQLPSFLKSLAKP